MAGAGAGCPDVISCLLELQSSDQRYSYSRPDTRAVNMLPLIALSLLASVMAQNLQCPTGVTNPNTFYIIGASGGDSTVSCQCEILMR